jgi:hypothetical protein
MAIGYWLMAIGYWLLAIGYWLMAIGYWLLAAAVSGVATYEGRGVGTARVACADVYCVRPCERDRHGRNAVFQEAGGETGLPCNVPTFVFAVSRARCGGGVLQKIRTDVEPRSTEL